MLTIRMYNLSDFLWGRLLISGLKGCTGIGAVVPIFRLYFFEYLHKYEANIEFDLYDYFLRVAPTLIFFWSHVEKWIRLDEKWRPANFQGDDVIMGSTEVKLVNFWALNIGTLGHTLNVCLSKKLWYYWLA